MARRKSKESELKALRLDKKILNKVNQFAEKENLNFTDAVESLLEKATEKMEMI